MANDGSEKKQPAAGEAREDRPRPRRRRRGRRSGDRPAQTSEGTSASNEAKEPREAKDRPRDPKEAKEGSREPRDGKEPKAGRSKSRNRRRGKGRKAEGKTDAAGAEEPRSSRSQTLPPPPRGPARAALPPAATIAGDEAPLPPAADSPEAKPRERRSRRGKRDEGAPRKPRPGRGERSTAEKSSSPRWSQAPAAPETPLAQVEPSTVESAEEPRPARRREPGPPVFLIATRDELTVDPDTAIDVTPWEVDIESGPGDGTLYNTVVVRGHRSHRARAYDAGDGVFDKGEVVAIEGDAGGPGTGVVVQPNRRELFRGRLPRVIRRLHENEVAAEPRGKRREQEVFRIARHVASSLDLPIKIVRSQAEPSGKTVVFFACEERIDFRELYRRVSAAAQGRIELRQVGVRDAAKMLGGVAPCGLQLCCTSFLKDFAPVSIKMAKEQGLVLNPQRVSGLCGRLLCCLTYEDELYRTQRKLLPKLGKRVVTSGGPGKVRDVDVLSQTIRVVLDTGEVVTVNPADITPMFPSQQSEERSDRQDGRCERRRREEEPGGERRRSSSGRRRTSTEETRRDAPPAPAKPSSDDEEPLDG